MKQECLWVTNSQSTLLQRVSKSSRTIIRKQKLNRSPCLFKCYWHRITAYGYFQGGMSAYMKWMHIHAVLSDGLYMLMDCAVHCLVNILEFLHFCTCIY